VRSIAGAFASRRAAFAATSAGLAAALLALPAAADPPPADPRITVPLLDVEPVLEDFADMRVPAHLEGRLARVEGFIQRTPHDGDPPSQPTEVYLAYDREHLYAVFLAFDDEPQRIRANMLPRGQISREDSVNIMIDTFNDQRRAYVFLATPRGIEADAQYIEGRGFDFSFEAVWHARGILTDRGYVVVMKIPFLSLRFPATDEQTWRVIFNRMIPRYGEDSYWPRYTLAIEGRLNQTALLEGIRGISPGRNVQLVPFVFHRSFRREEGAAGLPPDVVDDDETAIGLDAKFVLRDALVLDVTANPDYSQVEADEPQVTANERFEVFFPERRPFFLENADVFATPTDLVFTRRIVDPDAGVKLTGKQGKYAVGALVIDDEAPGKDPDAGPELSGERAGIGILRLSRDFAEQSRVGVLFTDRELADGFNRVGGADGRIKMGDNWIAEFQAVASSTHTLEGEDLDGVSCNAFADRTGSHLVLHTHYLYTSPGFRTELGFLPGIQRPDSQNLHHSTRYNFRPAASALSEWAPSVSVSRTLDAGGNGLDWSASPAVEWRWDGNTGLRVAYDHTSERLLPEDFAALAAAMDFPQDRWSAAFDSARHTRLVFGAGVDLGETINFVPPDGEPPALADFVQARVNAQWWPVPPLSLELRLLRNELRGRDDPGRIFTNSLGRVRANWQFTKELSLRLITDWERIDAVAGRTASDFNDDEQVTADVLLRYLWNPWKALYAGYTSDSRDFQELDAGTGEFVDHAADGDQVFVKFSYLFQL
jgi:hypothetical protein